MFYSYLVENGCWWLRQKQRDPATFLDGVEEARRRILTGSFPEYIEKEFAEMLEYFGQSPIIVRSSSLLEDNYGNAFAGKYESIFCANQGPHQKRLADFLAAVRAIYASTMSENALRYRAQRGLLDRDEQMSLLVQRVSGAPLGQLVLPAGRRRGVLVQSVRLEPLHRSQGGHGAAGVRAGHAGRRPVRRRLHAGRGAERSAAASRKRDRSGPAVLAAARRRDRSGGQSPGFARFCRRLPAVPLPCRSTSSPRRIANWPPGRPNRIWTNAVRWC